MYGTAQMWSFGNSVWVIMYFLENNTCVYVYVYVCVYVYVYVYVYVCRYMYVGTCMLVDVNSYYMFSGLYCTLNGI